MAEKLDPYDVAALERSVNDSAGRVSTIWLSYLLFGLYLATATVNVTQRQLFIADTMKLPVLGVDLPLVSFFLFAPILFVIFHAYVLIQLLLLARTALAYNEAVEHTVADASDRVRIRQRLANTLFAQLLAGSPREREGALGAMLKVMAWATLAIAPILVLLSFEIRFLPFHSSPVTWAHRALIAVDLVVVLLFWPAILDARREIGLRRMLKYRSLLAATIGLLAVAILVPTFPGEPHADLTRFGRYFLAPSSQTVPVCNARSWFEWLMPANFDRFFLVNEDLIEDEKIAKAERASKDRRLFSTSAEQSRSFRGRDLSCGWFAGVGLRHADFGHANMQGVILLGADVRGANFIGTRLQGADLSQARLQGARFIHAQLQGANLLGASLQGVDAGSALLDAADLRVAQLQGSNFKFAQLRGANLSGARLEGADFRWARLQSVDLSGAQLQGAALSYARLEGADLTRTRLDGTDLTEARLQGANLDQARLSLANISRAYLWRAIGANCEGAHVNNPRIDPLITANATSTENDEINATPEAIATFIEQVIQTVPAAGRETLRTNLHERLTGSHRESKTGRSLPEESGCTANSIPAEQYQRRLAEAMAQMICNLGVNRYYVADRLTRESIVAPLLNTPLELALASGILSADDKPCPAGKLLDEQAKEALRSIVAK